ncbi:MAG: hypothetical protein COA53_05415 [Rhodobacteraceae bacterium]|nr:MAG: hypothetical protein COA53_05415 [Paracoccaceae bacterium]
MKYLAIALAILATPTLAQPIQFDTSWEDLTFRGINATEYWYNGNTLIIQADNSSSVTYKALPSSAFGATRASWNWAVSQSVPVTDLTRKGGDDRNVTIYFMFLDRKSADKLDAGDDLSKMLRNRKVRMLLYIWGGEGDGIALPSPYFKGRGFYTILRGAGTGEARENIDLVADYTRIFGEAPEALVGIAISSDSDDTDSSVRAEISEMVLE